jgi:hypothetical protein
VASWQLKPKFFGFLKKCEEWVKWLVFNGILVDILGLRWKMLQLCLLRTLPVRAMNQQRHFASAACSKGQ